jgi:precorrin-6Y C5,15-methyltransferase (decarboxylating)
MDHLDHLNHRDNLKKTARAPMPEVPQKSHQLTVVGMGEAGCQGISSQAFNAVVQADVLVGAQRYLDFFQDFHGETIQMGEGGLKLKDVLASIRTLLPHKRVVVLASGDPLFFGIGSLLVREFPGTQIMPHPSSVQLAAARLGWRTEDLDVWSYHGRPVRDFLHRLRYVPRVAILTDQESSPKRLAQLILEERSFLKVPQLVSPTSDAKKSSSTSTTMTPYSLVHTHWRCWVAESLGSVHESLKSFSLEELAGATEDFQPLNILLLERCSKPLEEGGDIKDSPDDQGPGGREVRGSTDGGEVADFPVMVFPYLPEDAFAKRVPKLGLITKREVRVLSLAALGLRPGGVLWDLGAGSGSVGIEALLMARDLKVFAVECDPECVTMCEINARQMGLDLRGSYQVIPGLAPDVFESLPDPDHVFVGGSKGRLQDIIAKSYGRLKPGGRLVVNAITLDNVQEAYQGFLNLGLVPELSVVNVSRGIPLAGRYLRYEALNPVHIFWSTKK